MERSVWALQESFVVAWFAIGAGWRLAGAAFDARRWPCLGECHRAGGGRDGGGDGGDGGTDGWMDG
jgi:hypothetical protein